MSSKSNNSFPPFENTGDATSWQLGFADQSFAREAYCHTWAAPLPLPPPPPPHIAVFIVVTHPTFTPYDLSLPLLPPALGSLAPTLHTQAFENTPNESLDIRVSGSTDTSHHAVHDCSWEFYDPLHAYDECMSTFQESTGRVLDHFSYHDDPTNHLVDLGFDHSPNHSIVLGLDNMPIASFDQWQLEVCTVDEWVAHLNNDLLSSPPSQPEAQTVHEWDKLVVNDALPALPPPEIDFGDGEMIIEAIKSDGKLTCALGCSNVTFGRHIDVKRHHEAYHTDAVLWCPASDCPRNAVYGHYPFPLRKDKVRDHIRKMHKSDEEKQCWPEWFMQLKSGEKAGQTYKNNGRI